jgi:hypothetical protein
MMLCGAEPNAGRAFIEAASDSGRGKLMRKMRKGMRVNLRFPLLVCTGKNIPILLPIMYNTDSSC